MTDEQLAEVLERVDELVIGAMNEDAAPGMGVGIVRGSETIYAKGFGLADAAWERPVSSRTVFRIGSISKTMTAIGLMQLWEQGFLGLDDPVNDHLKHYQVNQPDRATPPVTFRHLLTHTSGIGELRGVTDLFKPVIGLGTKPGKPVPTPAQYYPKRLRPAVRPGTKWVYSNHAFNTLGQLVEDISGEPFVEYMRRQVFEPLSMENTDYVPSERSREALAQGYSFSRGALKPVDYLEITARGAGSVFSTVEDMCLYVAALLGGGANGRGKVLNRETLSVMTEPHYRLDDRLPAMGLALLLDDFGGHTVASHDGGWPGFLSSMHICPAFEVGVVVFVNASSRAAHEAADGLMSGLLGVPEPSSRLPHAGVLESPHLWPELRGFYSPEGPLNTNLRLWGTYAGELEVRVEGKHLVLRALAGPLRKGGRLYTIDSLDPLAFEVLVEGQAHPIVFGREREGGPREQVVRRVRPADQAPEGREPALQGAGRRGDGVGRSNVDRRKGTASAEGMLRSVDGPRRYLRIPLRLSTVANAHHKLREVGLRLPHPYLLGPIYLQRIEQVISTRLAPALHASANRSLSMTRSPDRGDS